MILKRTTKLFLPLRWPGIGSVAWIFPLLLASSLTSAPASAAPPEISAGARLAGACANCHGTNGKTQGDALPSLAGQDRAVLLANLKEYKSGKRTATVMHQITKGYTDEQLEILAAYFATQK
jgi:cytochrome subunit of sulfide dehydrogenase